MPSAPPAESSPFLQFAMDIHGVVAGPPPRGDLLRRALQVVGSALPHGDEHDLHALPPHHTLYTRNSS
ncbi:unnamed protein product [Peniophora sp. CBMAI 1063]|nr:unnamed protein product [Peniophora sp. CBMAI 1063]